ncbi:DUF559 domain-containing protein [Ornithinimicrobium sediminis]|uniref:DUF559 domain-containing protein n=1 Tax=Ornithinimicrobium sediminis TaxID=2904603 RepID=UPI001E4428CA|nr:DUF559 domain-containing protein [Ornithinimicrobium sediminis]MCE0485610.1 endonuclease domain-containing protein [Ornithinimicrobium sediminis]
MALDPVIAGRLGAQGGVSSVTELVDLGISRHVVSRAVARGDLVRLRRDVVVDAEVWRAAAPWERHALRARGTARAWRRAPFALSHHSALALLGLPVHGVDDRVHLARLDGVRRGGSATRIHDPVPEAFLTRVDDICVVDGPLAALQVADLFGVEAGLVSADAVVRQQGRARLTEALAGAPRGNGAGRAALVARLADGTSESAGESRTRWLLHVVGLPVPEPQAWISGEGGFSARVDFLFRAERVVVEFDGLLKYGTVRDVTAEKLREDALRRLGYEVVRLTWADLAHPERVHARVLAAFARSAARGRAS